jgi:hypothetical protein
MVHGRVSYPCFERLNVNYYRVQCKCLLKNSYMNSINKCTQDTSGQKETNRLSIPKFIEIPSRFIEKIISRGTFFLNWPVP